jgi:4'-phosphopantetheinyl transferase
LERDRRRFIVGRGVLRAILGLTLRIEPSRLRFRYGAQGKPQIEAAVGECALRFNLAHSQELALVAVGCGRELGIDVEQVHPLLDAQGIADQFFSEGESDALGPVRA